MRILLTRISNDRHSLTGVRDDGASDLVVLETRSCFDGQGTGAVVHGGAGG